MNKLIDTFRFWRFLVYILRCQRKGQTIQLKRHQVVNGSFYAFLLQKAKTQPACLRAKVLQYLRTERKEFPYTPNPNFDKYKQKYLAYFNRPDAIPSWEDIGKRLNHGEEVYVVRIDQNSYYPTSQTFSSYEMTTCWEKVGTIKQLKINRPYKIWPQFDLKQHDFKFGQYSPKGERNDFGFGFKDLTAHRYATQNEVKLFKKMKCEYKQLELEIEDTQKRVQELYKQQSIIEKLRVE